MCGRVIVARTPDGVTAEPIDAARFAAQTPERLAESGAALPALQPADDKTAIAHRGVLRHAR